MYILIARKVLKEVHLFEGVCIIIWLCMCLPGVIWQDLGHLGHFTDEKHELICLHRWFMSWRGKVIKKYYLLLKLLYDIANHLLQIFTYLYIFKTSLWINSMNHACINWKEFDCFTIIVNQIFLINDTILF